MVDEISESTIEQYQNLSGIVERLTKQHQQLSNIVSGLTTNLSNQDGMTRGLAALSKSAAAAGKDIKKVEEDAEKMSLSFAGLNMDQIFKPEMFKDVVDTMQTAAGKMFQIMNRLFSGLEKDSGNVKEALKSMIPIGLAAGQLEAVNKIPKPFLDAQEAILKSERALKQLTFSFGEIGHAAVSAQSAEKTMLDFNAAIGRTIMTTRFAQEEILNASRAMGQAFGEAALLQPLNNLLPPLKNTQSQITAVSAALLTARATGMEHSEVTKMMTEAHLDLGLSIEESVMMLGRIRDVAKESGLQFQTVAKTVMESAKTLKMWGGTVDSVAPLFASFSKSLQGIGREGLTPELLNSFVGGLEKMQFSTRALLSMQMPGMRAGGLLGGGLKMEAALEKGPEGMKDIVGSITETLKKFGGQQILTREQAMESPALTRNFMIQRQLLSQLVGVSDPAKQNQMLNILQNIDKGGLAVGGDQSKALDELLSQGEQTAESTSSVVEKASTDLQAAIQISGSQVVSAIMDLGIGKSMTEFRKNVLEEVIRTGRVSEKAVASSMEMLSPGEQKPARLNNRQIKDAEKIEQTKLGQGFGSISLDLQKIMREFKPKGAEREQFIEKGVVSKDMQDMAKADTLEKIMGRMSKLTETKERSRAQEAELFGLKNAFDKLSKSNLSDELSQITKSERKQMLSELPAGRISARDSIEEQPRFEARRITEQQTVHSADRVMAQKVSVDVDVKQRALEIPIKFNISADKQTITIELSEKEKSDIIEIATNKSFDKVRGNATGTANP